jgi:hypothetical protein
MGIDLATGTGTRFARHCNKETRCTNLDEFGRS